MLPFEAGFGPSIFSQTDTEIWKPIRKGVAPAFSSAHVDRMNRVSLEQAKSWMKKRLDYFVNSGDSFDPGIELVSFTIGVICEAAFEFKPTAEEVERFLEELHIWVDEFAMKCVFNPFRKYFHFLLPEAKRA